MRQEAPFSSISPSEGASGLTSSRRSSSLVSAEMTSRRPCWYLNLCVLRQRDAELGHEMQVKLSMLMKGVQDTEMKDKDRGNRERETVKYSNGIKYTDDLVIDTNIKYKHILLTNTKLENKLGIPMFISITSLM